MTTTTDQFFKTRAKAEDYLQENGVRHIEVISCICDCGESLAVMGVGDGNILYSAGICRACGE